MAPHQRPRAMPGKLAPYRSISCRIGTHGECVQSSPATAPVGVPVVYEACNCSCHTVDLAAPREVPQ